MISTRSKATTVHLSVYSSNGTYTAKPFDVLKCLNRLLSESLTLWLFSAMPMSKCMVKGVPE
jgi:hypothetical protein